jgi:hypothetical protein
MQFDKTGFRWLASGACLACSIALSGCSSPFLRDDKPISTTTLSAVDPDSVQLVSDLTRPWGLNAQEVQGVSLVVGLNGTGSDPGPTAERSMLKAEMQTRGVERPSEVLASRSTALAMVRGRIPPGARKGDRFDLEVRVPAGSETLSLHGGWMMQSRLREYAKLNDRLGNGHVLAYASGDVLTDDVVEGDGDTLLKTRGRILGGGIVGTGRNLGLVLRDDFTSVKASAQVGRAINGRFHMFHRGNKEGVAIPKRDSFVELRVHPRYRDNIVRYVRVIQNIAVRESPSHLTQRLERLRPRLIEVNTAALAAVQLEAIGEPGINVLEDGLASADPEVRFYSAEALAYLDEESATDVLSHAARHEPAFRWRALTALGAMDDIAAHESLISLLNAESAEARYGAFRILKRLTPDDPVIRGQVLGEEFYLHVVSSTGPGLVHVAKTERPEIVLFGSEHQLREPVVVFAGSEIVVRSDPGGGLRLRRLTAGEEDQEVRVSAELEEMIRGIVDLGGGYPEVVQAISEAKSTGALPSRLEFSAMPELGRVYHRDADEEAGGGDSLANGAGNQATNRAISGQVVSSQTEPVPEGLSELDQLRQNARTLPPVEFLDPDPEPDYIVTDQPTACANLVGALETELQQQGHGVAEHAVFNEPSAGDTPASAAVIPRKDALQSNDVRPVEFTDLVDPAVR